MIDISILVPFLNEEEQINNLVSNLNEFCSSNPQTFEVLFIDDGSTDASVEKILSFKNEISFSSRIIKLSKNHGSHDALRAGVKVATGDFVGFIYADLQDPLELIIKMHKKAIDTSSNIVWASRKSTNEDFASSLLSNLYHRLMKAYVLPNYPVNGFDIVLFDKKVRSYVNKNIEANSSIFLNILTLGFKQASIEYDKHERKIGKSKWTVSKKIKLFIDSFVAFSYVPIRFVTIIGILLFVSGFCFSSYLIARKLLFNDLGSGWPMLISLITTGFGVTNISLGIIAEYLWRTLDASRKRPVFIIDDIIELKNNNKG